MHSQHDEERYILEATAGAKGKRLLDIGAFDGKDKSNSYALIEQGWTGILVEPSPEAFISLLKLHSGNPGITLVHAAVVPEKAGMVAFWNSEDLISTTVEKHYEKWKTQAKFNGKFYVPSVTVMDIINQFGAGFDFINIDTEGSSVDLFLRTPINSDHAKHVVCVEHDNRIVECHQHAAQNGLTLLHMNGTNILYHRI